MIWPFLALQLLFVCVPSFRQVSYLYSTNILCCDWILHLVFKHICRLVSNNYVEKHLQCIIMLTKLSSMSLCMMKGLHSKHQSIYIINSVDKSKWSFYTHTTVSLETYSLYLWVECGVDLNHICDLKIKRVYTITLHKVKSWLLCNIPNRQHLNFIFACTTCALSAILTYVSCYICMLRFHPLNKFLGFFFFFFFQTSNSAYISLLTVALQLCGIPIEFTHKINFLFTALLVAIKDFGVFFFSVVVVHCLVEYSISVGLLKYVMETWTRSFHQTFAILKVLHQLTSFQV